MGKSLKKWTTVALSFAVACAAALPMTAFAAEGDVAEVDGTGYQTVQAAIDAADGKTVILLADTQENVTIAKDTTITLDLGTFTLTNKDAKHTITNQGTLKVVGTGKVDNVNHGQAALWNEGVANLNGGTFDRSKDAGTSADTSNNNSYYTIVNHGTMTINDGVTVQQPGKYSSLLENGWYNGAQNTSGEPSVLTINGGTFTGGLNTIKNDDYGQLTIEGGTFTNVAQAALLNWNEAEISGGTFKVDEGAPYVVLNGYLDDTMDQGQLTITDGTFTGGEDTIALATMGGSANSGAVEIAGGRFDGDIVLQGTQAGGLLEIADEAVINGDVTNGGLDEVVISGGTVSGAVANNGEGTLGITGGTFAQQPDSALIDEDSAVVGYTPKQGDKAFYVGAGAIRALSEKVAAGDALDVLQGDLELTIDAAGVKVVNSGKGTVKVNDETVTDEGYVTPEKEDDTTDDDITDTGSSLELVMFAAVLLFAAGAAVLFFRKKSAA